MGSMYTGLIHKDTDSDYGVSFPDLPGCIAAGRAVEEAREMAAEALSLHLEALTTQGHKVPQPSSADTVLAHPDAHDALALLVVEAMPAPAEIA
jgi:predicted RNase H-like HicB family nuclease